jgi:hypothetical protein
MRPRSACGKRLGVKYWANEAVCVSICWWYFQFVSFVLLMRELSESVAFGGPLCVLPKTLARFQIRLSRNRMYTVKCNNSTLKGLGDDVAILCWRKINCWRKTHALWRAINPLQLVHTQKIATLCHPVAFFFYKSPVTNPRQELMSSDAKSSPLRFV